MPITYTYGAEDAQPDFLETGTYPGVVKKADDKPSKSGNEMITLLWTCDNGFGIWDHLVDLPNCRWKSDQLLVATGNAPESGNKVVVLDAEDMEGWAANLKLILRDGKNEIEGYEPLTKEQTEKKNDNKPF